MVKVVKPQNTIIATKKKNHSNKTRYYIETNLTRNQIENTPYKSIYKRIKMHNVMPEVINDKY